MFVKWRIDLKNIRLVVMSTFKQETRVYVEIIFKSAFRHEVRDRVNGQPLRYALRCEDAHTPLCLNASKIQYKIPTV